MSVWLFDPPKFSSFCCFGQMKFVSTIAVSFGFLLTGMAWADSKIDELKHRSPVDLAVSPSNRWVVTANETSDSVSLIRVADGEVVDELSVGSHPADVVFTPDGQSVLVSSTWSGELTIVSIENNHPNHKENDK